MAGAAGKKNFCTCSPTRLLCPIAFGGSKFVPCCEAILGYQKVARPLQASIGD
jgi:hypothetical protein